MKYGSSFIRILESTLLQKYESHYCHYQWGSGLFYLFWLINFSCIWSICCKILSIDFITDVQMNGTDLLLLNYRTCRILPFRPPLFLSGNQLMARIFHIILGKHYGQILHLFINCCFWRKKLIILHACCKTMPTPPWHPLLMKICNSKKCSQYYLVLY